MDDGASTFVRLLKHLRFITAVVVVLGTPKLKFLIYYCRMINFPLILILDWMKIQT